MIPGGTGVPVLQRILIDEHLTGVFMMKTNATRILFAVSMCLSLATFSGLSAQAQGKMKKDKPMKMEKPMMKHDDDMMMEDHAMGMMMESDSIVNKSAGYPFAAPGSMTACTYSEMCAMMSGDKKMMMHDDKMMGDKMMGDKMMHEEMMESEHPMSRRGYPYAAPGNMPAMSYSEMCAMMSEDHMMNDKMMMHDDDKMMGGKMSDKPMKMKKEKMMKKSM